MFRRLAFLLTIITVLLFIPIARAQDLPEACTAEALTALTTTIQQANDTATASIKSGDLSAALETLAAAQAEMSAMQSTCAGLSWEGKNPKVIGPVEIPAGLYRATATTKGFMIAQITLIDGDCGAKGISAKNLFSLFKGDADEGAEAILESDGCTALLEISNVQEAWTLTLEKLG